MQARRDPESHILLVVKDGASSRPVHGKSFQAERGAKRVEDLTGRIADQPAVTLEGWVRSGDLVVAALGRRVRIQAPLVGTALAGPATGAPSESFLKTSVVSRAKPWRHRSGDG